MPVAKTVLKNTNQEAVIKVAGTAAAATIDLQTDILASTQVLDGDTQRVNILSFNWSGGSDGIISITRNSIVIATLQANAAGMMYFDGQSMIPDSIENTSDIVVTISGAQCELWIKVRKVSGYATKVETATYGAYDDETRVGASTTLSGSPDKV